jgi:AraC-like DNA-binding protein
MNAEPLRSVLLALPVATVGVMLAMAAGMLRTQRPSVRWTGVAFMLSVAAYALKLWDDEVHALPDALLVARTVVGAGAVGWFLLFVLAMFEDEPKARPGALAVVPVLILLDLIGASASEPWRVWLGVLANLTRVAVALLALAVIVRGWKGDLVEPRRRLRGPFLVTIATYILVTRSFMILSALGMAPGWFMVTNAAILFLVATAASLVFLESRGELFEASPLTADPRAPARRLARASPAALPCADLAAKADLERLQVLMETGEAWREEGLSIAGLALRARMPESQLRRLINDQLGYRNFPSFVNAHRIAAAKTRLSDPEEARTSISAIAFEIGFASLGPFNRAFKEETGVSPSEWRRKSLGIDESTDGA